jgi:hypothetical protein
MVPRCGFFVRKAGPTIERRSRGRRRPIREQKLAPGFYFPSTMEVHMGFGRGLLLWLIGIPLPLILLLALFMHH